MGFSSRLLLALSLFLLLPAVTLAEPPGPASALDPPVPPTTATSEDETVPAAPGPQIAPIELKIPILGVDADVLPVGMDADGAMGVPQDPDTAVWWSLGPGTGVPGNVVIAAHVDWAGRLRVFGLLYKLGRGDEVVLVDEKLREFHYQVVSSQWVSAEGAPVDQIFGGSGVPEVTLITCGGEFDRSTRQYLDRLIVRAIQV
jgi:hypothetical protein